RSHQPDIVLLETKLGASDGIELVKQLLAERRCAVVMISADSEIEAISRAAAAGAFGYLIKPITREALAAQIEIAVTRCREHEKLIVNEERRQASTLELIASENHVSKAVMEAAGTCLTNKYAEGYPGARYYGGCGFYDEIENIAIERAKQLFGCRFANVQPHSG